MGCGCERVDGNRVSIGKPELNRRLQLGCRGGWLSREDNSMGISLCGVHRFSDELVFDKVGAALMRDSDCRGPVYVHPGACHRHADPFNHAQIH